MCYSCHINFFTDIALLFIKNTSICKVIPFLLKYSFWLSQNVTGLHKCSYINLFTDSLCTYKMQRDSQIYEYQSQFVQLYQIIHTHPVTIFNNGIFAETMPSWNISLCLWWLHYYGTTKKMNIKESLWMHVLSELYFILKFALTYQRENSWDFLKCVQYSKIKEWHIKAYLH